MGLDYSGKLEWMNLATLVDCWDFQSEISLVHPENLQFESFSVGLFIEESIRVPFVDKRSDCCKLTLKTTEEKEEEEVTQSYK